MIRDDRLILALRDRSPEATDGDFAVRHVLAMKSAARRDNRRRRVEQAAPGRLSLCLVGSAYLGAAIAIFFLAIW